MSSPINIELRFVVLIPKSSAAMFYFLLLVLCSLSATLALAFQKVLSKFISSCLEIRNQKEEETVQGLIKENRRLRKEVLSSQEACAELEKLVAVFQAGKQESCSKAHTHHETLERLLDMNVFAVAGGECWHFDKDCLAARARGGNSKCLKFRPCMVCVKKMKKVF